MQKISTKEPSADLNPEFDEKPELPKKHRPKKSFTRLFIGWVVYLAFIAGLILGTPKVLSAWLKTSTPIAAITSGSMWPALKKGDLILITAVQSQDIKVDDIIVYTNEKGYTIHRVIKINKETITTKGDANNISDAPVTFDKIIGKSLEYSSGSPVRIPRLGFISLWVSGYLNKSS